MQYPPDGAIDLEGFNGEASPVLQSLKSALARDRQVELAA